MSPPSAIKDIKDQDDEGKVGRKKSVLGSIMGSIMRRKPSSTTTSTSSSLKPKVPEFGVDMDDVSSVHSTYSVKSTKSNRSMVSHNSKLTQDLIIMPSAVEVEAAFAEVAQERFGTYNAQQFDALGLNEKWQMVLAHKQQQQHLEPSPHNNTRIIDSSKNALSPSAMISGLNDDLTVLQRLRVALTSESIAWIKEFISLGGWLKFVTLATDIYLSPISNVHTELYHKKVMEIAKAFKAFSSCNVGLQCIMSAIKHQQQQQQQQEGHEQEDERLNMAMSESLTLAWLLMSYPTNDSTNSFASQTDMRNVRHAMMQLIAVMCLYRSPKSCHAIWKAWRMSSRLLRENCLGDWVIRNLAQDIKTYTSNKEVIDVKIQRYFLDALILLNALISSIDDHNSELLEEENEERGMAALKERMVYRTFILRDPLKTVLPSLYNMGDAAIDRQLDFFYEDAKLDGDAHGRGNNHHYKKRSSRVGKEEQEKLISLLENVDANYQGAMMKLLLTLITDWQFSALNQGHYPALLYHRVLPPVMGIEDVIGTFQMNEKQEIRIETLNEEKIKLEMTLMEQIRQQRTQFDLERQQLQMRISSLEGENQKLQRTAKEKNLKKKQRDRKESLLSDINPMLNDEALQEHKKDNIAPIEEVIEEGVEKMSIKEESFNNVIEKQEEKEIMKAEVIKVASGPPVPPPPPPPAPPKAPALMQPSTNGICKNERKNNIAREPTIKMRTLPWTKIPEHQLNENTVWFKLNVGKWTLDYDLLEKHFCQLKRDNKSSEGASPSKNGLINMTRSNFLSAKIATNLGIALRRLKATPASCQQALRSLDLTIFDEQLSQELLQIDLSNEERERIHELNNSRHLDEETPLPLPEQFLVHMYAVPLYEQRLKCMLFMSTFPEWHHDISQQCETFLEQLDKMTSSKTLQALLEVILATGNFMNDGTFRGNAKAFQLDILDMLSSLKSNDNSMSLLEYVLGWGSSNSNSNSNSNSSSSLLPSLPKLSSLMDEFGLFNANSHQHPSVVRTEGGNVSIWLEQFEDKERQFQHLRDTLQQAKEIYLDIQDQLIPILEKSAHSYERQLVNLKTTLKDTIPHRLRRFFVEFGYNKDDGNNGSNNNNNTNNSNNGLIGELHRFAHEVQRILQDLNIRRRRQQEEQERRTKGVALQVRQLLETLPEHDRQVVDSVLDQLRNNLYK